MKRVSVALCAVLIVVVAGCGQKAKLDGAQEPQKPSGVVSEGGNEPGAAGAPSGGAPAPSGTPASTSTPKPTTGGDIIDGDGSEKPSCDPVSCAALGYDCGKIPDGCGSVIECGACPEGQICGAATPNVCLDPETLTDPIAMQDACADKQCGGEGNGRGDSYDCGQCSSDQVCGILQNFQCAPLHPPCTPASSCADLGWECGIAFDDCGNTFDCAAEGRTCNALSTCTGGLNGPTTCDSSATCDVCGAVPDCSAQPAPTTLTGRVITAGRDDANTGNQVGVPNAFVYILANDNPDDLPDIAAGLPDGGTACDRCDGQDLGPVLASAATDALGNFKLEGDVPVGTEFLLVTKVGKFRRAVPVTLPETAACGETAIDSMDTRLPRTMDDGVRVNIPRIAVSTGDVDAMECVLEKMGIADSEFDVGADTTSPARVHLYGTDGAEMPAGNPTEEALQGDAARLDGYDMVVFDCQGGGYLDPPMAADLDNVRDYVNRGGRMFASHLSFQWICSNGTTPYSAADPLATGLAPSADFPGCGQQQGGGDNQGTGTISVGRPNANPGKIQDFADWLVNENAVTQNADGSYTFTITDPRELASATAAFPGSEEFVYREEMMDDQTRSSVQQYSFNTPFGAPEEAACGRVAYSGFHVAASAGGGNNRPFANAVFPEHCDGDLTAQEKVLLYMLFDLGACVGSPPTPPPCDPIGCGDLDAECGFIGDGCGQTVDCGPCPEGQVCGVVEPNHCSGCVPLSCQDVGAECGVVGDGCGQTVDCGPCPPGELCGILTPFMCDPPPDCTPLECEGDDCGDKSDGCGGTIDCGKCPEDSAR
jgi:hypothetical protein